MQVELIKNKFLELENIDQQINLINKYAHLIKDKSLEIDLSMKHLKEKEINDEDHFEKHVTFYFGNGSGNNERIEKNKESISLKINEIMSLEILGVIAAHLESKRMFILKNISKLGLKYEK